jgi:hypothetical protein
MSWSWAKLKFAGAVRGKANLLNHLRQNSLTESVHVIGCTDVHKSSNLRFDSHLSRSELCVQ